MSQCSQSRPTKREQRVKQDVVGGLLLVLSTCCVHTYHVQYPVVPPDLDLGWMRAQLTWSLLITCTAVAARLIGGLLASLPTPASDRHYKKKLPRRAARLAAGLSRVPFNSIHSFIHSFRITAFLPCLRTDAKLHYVNMTKRIVKINHWFAKVESSPSPTRSG